MPETNAIPTEEEVSNIRSDIHSYLINGRTVESHCLSALSQFKIDLEDQRDILFSRLFDSTNDLYYVDHEGIARNDSKCILMLSYLSVSMIFRDYAIRQGQSTWWDLANEYEARYQDRLRTTKLDVDLSENGEITEDETRQFSQSFMRA